MIVAVTDADVALADARLSDALIAGFVDYRGSGDVRVQARNGFVAEIAVARTFHVEWARASTGPDGGIDLWLDTHGVQVKWNSYTGVDVDYYPRPDLRFRADYGILVTPAPPGSVRLRGWLSRAQFEAWAQPKSYGYNIVRAVPASRLRPIESLLDRWLSRPFT